MKSCCNVCRCGKESPDLGGASEVKTSKQTEDMVLVPAGQYTVGTNDTLGYAADFEGPEIRVETPGFLMDSTSVTNSEFAEFVDATGYITEAEDIGSSFVFHLLLEAGHQGTAIEGMPWWYDVPGASWMRPFGDSRDYTTMLDHPVVHITMRDALRYCDWAGKRLPSEIEWEIAARGGTSGTTFPWGSDLEPNGDHACNVFQGNFPWENSEADGYRGTSPVTAFYENAYGLKQMIGNVWELCSNRSRIPLERITPSPLDAQMATYTKGEFRDYAAKGGSFLCHDSYCNRYRLAARNGIDRHSSSSNCGFRCVRDL